MPSPLSAILTRAIVPRTPLNLIWTSCMPSGVSEVVPTISSPVWPSSVGATGGGGVGEFTVKVKLVVLLIPPPVLVTVIVYVPAGVEAVVATFKVREQVGLQEVDVV